MLEAFEMWIWRRMEPVSWKDNVTNTDVLQKVNETRRILGNVWRWNIAGLDMFLRTPEFVTLFLSK